MAAIAIRHRGRKSMDEDQNSVEDEVTPQDQESEVVEEQHQENLGEDSQGQEENQQEKNWRELRRKAEEAERRASQTEERLKMQNEFIKNLVNSQKAHQQPAAPEEPEWDPTEYATYGNTDKLIEKKAAAIAERKYLELEQKREQQRWKERLTSKYSDFDQVVNPETIEIFEREQPELATTIAELKDPYKMGLQTYNLIKSMGIVGSPDEKRHAREAQKKIEKNEKAIQSPQAYNKRPMAQAFSMTNMSRDEKKKLYEEMMGFASGAAGY